MYKSVYNLQVYQACAGVPQKGLFYPPTLITGVQTVSNVVVEEVMSFTRHILALLARKPVSVYCIRGTGPAYFKHVCTPASDISGRAHLCSAKRRDMLVPRTRTELGQQSFPAAALTIWNSLLAHLC